jgi:hypothetical protein
LKGLKVEEEIEAYVLIPEAGYLSYSFIDFSTFHCIETKG